MKKNALERFRAFFHEKNFKFPLDISSILYIMIHIQYVHIQQDSVKFGGNMKIILSNQSEKPIYLQIKEQLEEQVLSGEILENTYLPSIRQMASELGVSVITTTRAYKELEADGFIATVPGKGCIVLAPNNNILREQYLRRMEDGFMQAAEAAKKLKMPFAEAQEIFKTVWDM